MKATIKQRTRKKRNRNASNWQQKYGKSTTKQYEQEGTASASAGALAPSTYTSDSPCPSSREMLHVEACSCQSPDTAFDGPLFFFGTNESEDVEADEVISQMNAILNGDPSTYDITAESEVSEAAVEADYLIDFEQEINKYLQLPNLEKGPHIKTTDDESDEAFSLENMATLFRRTGHEKVLRKCFDCLVSHKSQNKLLRCQLKKVFSAWKIASRKTKESTLYLVSRTRRRHKLRQMRSILSSWTSIVNDRAIVEQRVSDMKDWRVKNKVFSAWRSLQRADARERRSLKTARSMYQTHLKMSFFAMWRSVAEKNRPAKPTAPAKTKAGQAEVRQPTGNTIVVEDEETPSKAAKVTCVTPERNATVAEQEMKCITPEKKKLTTSAQNDTAAKRLDKENKRPNRKCDKQLLQPLKPKRMNPKRYQSTPKLVTEMETRNQEREQRRAVLRIRYEEKAIEKKKRLEEAKRMKDEDELAVHQEYIRRKASEEQRKKIAASRWKQACRLSLLHYRMSLQKRMFLRWKKISRVNEFNNRKAKQAWSDKTYEKCWHIWKLFKHEEQQRRKEMRLKNQQLADYFNEKRLLSKAFASLELYSTYSRALVDEGQHRVSVIQLRSMLGKWRFVASRVKRERSSRERKARKYGKKLLMLRAMQSWQLGVSYCKEEREMDKKIQAKWSEVNKWLSSY